MEDQLTSLVDCSPSPIGWLFFSSFSMFFDKSEGKGNFIIRCMELERPLSRGLMNKQVKSVEEEFEEFQIPLVDEKGEELTKSARKKLLAKAKKDARKNASAQANSSAQKKEEEKDSSEGKYGVRPLIQSQSRGDKKFVLLQNLSAANEGETVLFRARVHNMRPQAKIVFLVLRQQCYSIQGVCFRANCSAQMLKFIQKVSNETVVDVVGKLVKPDEEIKSASQGDIEIHVSGFHVVSAANPMLPLRLEDAERPREAVKAQKKEIAAITAKLNEAKEKLAAATEEAVKEALNAEIKQLAEDIDTATKFVVVGRATRLDYRYIDLRTSANQAMLRIKSGVCQLFREFLYTQGFTEIQSPKLIGTASEGGADVFKLGYFGGQAYLAQSPQLYKQMSISSDLDRVFEVGPVFRAENSKTKRHMTEFIGLDMEMAFYEHYHEVLDVLDELFVFIFDGLNQRYPVEIERIRAQFPFEDLKYSRPSLRLQWPQAIALLRENGVEIGDLEDFSLEVEKTLGNIVRAKYDTDFFMLDKFPLAIRPFYTMPCPEDPLYSNSYDFFIRGQEIVSGAQRVHDPELLLKQAQALSVDVEKISDYIDCFKYGAFPHAGAGVGLERVVMLFFGLDSVQDVSMFPRTPYRLRP